MKQRSRRPHRRQDSSPGSPPGTLRVDPGAPKPVLRLIAYGPDDATEREDVSLDEIAAERGKWPVVWVNVDGLGDADTLTRLGAMFDLHPLALEDIVNLGQRPKVDQYGEQLFIVTRMASLNERLETEQLSLFLGRGFILTFQEHVGDCLEPLRERIRKGTGRIRGQGADYLAYGVLDQVIDAYFPLLETFGERLEALEEAAINRPDRSTVRQIHATKRNLLALRRALWPQREAVNTLLRESWPLLTEDTRLYLRDCYDHAIQIMDMLETCRELASGLMDAYMSSVSNRMNQVMKVLTVIATIFIPLTFIAGVYGMNFDREASPWNMPELGWRYGYPAVLIVMAAIAAVMLIYFRRKGWLGEPASAESDRDEED